VKYRFDKSANPVIITKINILLTMVVKI